MNVHGGMDLFDFYQKCLVPLTPHPAVCRIIEFVMAGGETTDDFAQILAVDAELQHWVRLTIQRLGFDKRNQKLDQMITLLGQNRVRNLIIGRNIERKFVKEQDSLLGKLAAQNTDAAAKNADSAAKNPDGAPTEGDQEAIPDIAAYVSYLSYANRAEEIAISIRNSYPGQAFAGGVTFDYIRQFFKTITWTELKDSRLQKVDDYLEEIFLDGIRCAIAANEITQKISISHQRTVFVISLLRNIGKALMLAYDPAAFERAFLASTGASGKGKRVDSAVSEKEEFDFDHAQIGSLYIGRLPYLAEIERSVDYHHNPHLLRFSNPKLFALACLLRVSGGFSKLYQRQRKENTDTDRMPDSKLIASEEFKFLKLNADDWSEIKANYALKIMKAGL